MFSEHKLYISDALLKFRFKLFFLLLVHVWVWAQGQRTASRSGSLFPPWVLGRNTGHQIASSFSCWDVSPTRKFRSCWTWWLAMTNPVSEAEAGGLSWVPGESGLHKWDTVSRNKTKRTKSETTEVKKLQSFWANVSIAWLFLLIYFM